MKNVMATIFILLLLILPTQKSYSGEPAAAPENKIAKEALSVEELSERMSNAFTKTALGKINSGATEGLNTSVLEGYISKYSLGMARTILDAGVAPAVAKKIMNKSVVWYADAVVQIYNATNFYIPIREYIDKIGDLFYQEKLEISVQSPIISLSSSNLKEIGHLLNPSQEPTG